MHPSPGARGGLPLLNKAEAIRAMDRFYDPLLRDAGVTGTVMVDVTVQADGGVRDAAVVSSTHDRFSDSALRVVRELRFAPFIGISAVVHVRMQFMNRHGQGEIAVMAR